MFVLLRDPDPQAKQKRLWSFLGQRLLEKVFQKQSKAVKVLAFTASLKFDLREQLKLYIYFCDRVFVKDP